MSTAHVVRHAALVTSLLIALASFAQPAAAQQPNIKVLNIELWPEFDKPAMLVMASAKLAPDTPLPATVTLTIPASVGEPHATAFRDQTGNLLVAQYARRIDGEWAHIDLVTQSTEVRVEYYQALATDNPSRNTTVKLLSTSPVGAVEYIAQAPIGAEGYTVTPAAKSSAPRPDGLTYHIGELGSFEANKEIALTVAYTKADPKLSVEVMRAQQPPPMPPGGTGLPPQGQLPPQGLPPQGGQPTAQQGVTPQQPKDSSNTWLIVAIVAIVLVFGGFMMAKGGDEGDKKDEKKDA